MESFESPRRISEQEQLFLELKDMAGKKRGENFVEKNETIFAFFDDMKKMYGEDAVRRAKLFHALIGSTIDDASSPEFDLPNGEIERFIRDEL